MGETLRGAAGGRRRRGRAAARLARAGALLVAFLAFAATAAGAAAGPAALRLDQGRFTVVAEPVDATLARALLEAAAARDTFPGLPRPVAHVVIAIATDRSAFRRLTGGLAPEWGAAVAFPASGRVVMQGRGAASDAGDPAEVLRHELAHLALHEYLGELPPRWFDEGYASWAAGELGRDEYLSASVALALRGTPTLAALDSGFYGGADQAQASYALAYRAVADLAALDETRGLSLFFRYWREDGRFDVAVRAAYGVTGAEFERRWRQDTRRRFGVLAVLTDLSLGSVLLLLPILPFWVARRRRDRRRLAELRAADAAAEREAEQSGILALMLATHPFPPSGVAARGTGGSSLAPRGAPESAGDESTGASEGHDGT